MDKQLREFLTELLAEFDKAEASGLITRDLLLKVQQLRQWVMNG